MCFYHDDEFADVSRDTVRKARKPHACAECPEEIAPGDRYLETATLFEGEWHTSRCCLRCEYDLYRIFLKEKKEGCQWDERFPAEGELSEALSDAGWERTQANEVPEGFRFKWRIAAWAEETRALVNG